MTDQTRPIGSSFLARNIVTTSHPLAAEAGLSMLKQGGNAVDAAVAAAVALTVVEPTSNGIGGDAFAIIWDGQKLHGLSGSGRSPLGWNVERFRNLESMPLRGWDSVTTPGAVAAWFDLSERFGTLPFADLFEPAIKHAAEGYAVTPITAAAWKRAEESLGEFEEFRRVFLPEGRAPIAGQTIRFPEIAATLREIAVTGGRSFYEGELADRIAEVARQQSGALARIDLEKHRSEWVEPLSVPYRNYELHELPPNCQGIAALLAVGIADRLGISELTMDSVDSTHLLIEAMKLAFADAFSHLSDPEFMQIGIHQLLEPDYLDIRAGMIDRHTAQFPTSGFSRDKGTVYLTTADADGMMVSFIQSNYHGFGSGIVIPGTGISMQNRGFGFSLEPGHPNEVGSGKKPFHTIIPAFVTKEGAPFMSFGVMGGFMQPQGHLQMMTRILDHGIDPQAASDAPRWSVLENDRVALEPGFHHDVINGLRERGHNLVLDAPVSTFGGAQIIQKQGALYAAGSDHRKDSCPVGY